ncbi:MAG TPA: DUF262 domain-containing protein, partial [Saprospiraceae bacterium]|nr:DUF262 domain-containing protein [Saprospiraceae bacterium]
MGYKVMSTAYESKIYNLGDKFFNRKFNISIYQRLYVWGEDQVNTLLEDLIRAYQHDKEHIYYLGGLVVVNNCEKLDLIDGQQRFTTLKILREILGDTDLILEFSVRDKVWNDFNTSIKTDNADIKRMKSSKQLLEIGLKKTYNNLPIDNTEFLKYIKEKVNLVVTTVPKNTDLNKLFELINGRGEQLQQHEVLKAKILSHIGSEKNEYGNIWDICSNMDDYIEISIKKSLLKKDGEKLKNISWGDYFNTHKDLNIDDLLKHFKDVSENMQIEKTKNKNSISSIIENDIEDITKTKHDDPEDEASTQYLPIISFQLFLLYVLVSLKKDVYFNIMKKEKIEFKDKNLIKIFTLVLLKELKEDTAENNAKDFIKYLFKMRKLFDKWIIRNCKTVGDSSNTANHQINQIKKIMNGNVISRQIELIDNSKDLALLQSMLYHSHTRNTQEWIIPFLESMQNE